MLAEPAYDSPDSSVTSQNLLLQRETPPGGGTTAAEPLNGGWQRREYEPPPFVTGVPGEACECEKFSGKKPSKDETAILLDRKYGATSCVMLAFGEEEHHATRQKKCDDNFVEHAWASIPADISEVENVATVVKQLKAEERRRRNRESAHRSNERKRAVKQALHKELCRERQRICVLRMRQKRLLEENSRLWARVAIHDGDER